MEAPILPNVDGSSLDFQLSTDLSRRSRVLTCKRCKFSTVDSKQFLSHQFNVHSTDDDGLRCDKCPFETSIRTELLTHKRTKHRRSLVLSHSRKNSMEGDSGFLEETNNNNNNNTNPIKPSAVSQDVIYSQRSGDHHDVRTPSGDGIMVYECAQCTFATTELTAYSKHINENHRDKRANEFQSKPIYQAGYDEPSEANDRHEDEYDGYGEANSSFGTADRDRDFEIKQMQKSYGSEQQLRHGNGSYRLQEADDDEQALVIDESTPKPYIGGTSLLSRPSPVQPSPITMPVRAKPGPKPNSGVSKPRTGCAPVREAVDPAKYITIQEPDGIKYACSKCGNIYKWRKSLNKHWKEKHEGEIPDPRPNLTALNIPRLGKGYVTGLPNGKGNVISFMGPQQHIESPPKSNQAAFMAGGDVSFKSSAIRTALKRPAMIEVAAQETFRKNASVVRPSPSTHHRGQPNKITKITKQEAYSRYNDSPGSTEKTMQSFAKFSPSPSNLSKGRGPNGNAAMDLSKLHQHQMTSSREIRKPLDPDVLDLSKKSLEISIRQISPEKAVRPSLQDEPMDLSIRPKCDVIVSSIKRETERVGGFSYIKEEIGSLSRQCPSCSYKASNKQDYDNHMELHLRKQHFKCAECQQVFATMDGLNEHFIKLHTETINQNLMGNINDPALKSKSLNSAESTQLYKYLTMDSQHQQLTCMVCGVIFQWQWTLAKHFQQEHHMLPNPYQKKPGTYPGSSGPDQGSSPSSSPLMSEDEYPNDQEHLMDDLESLQCTQCGYVGSSPPDLIKHQLKHSIGRQFICRVCSYMTKCKEEMIQHYKMDHPTAAVDLNQIVAHSVSGPVSPESGQYLSGTGKQYIDLTDEDTAIVFPQAPEDEVSGKSGRRECKPGKHNMERVTSPTAGSSTEANLPFKCTVCEYRARWPSEITQHTKNHSDEKPYLCPRCSYRSKWKWDVVKHLKRCGGGTVNDVIDTTKQRKAHNVHALVSDTAGASKGGPYGMSMSHQRELLSNGPPNVTVLPADGPDDLSMDLSIERDPNDSLNLSEEGPYNDDDRPSFGNSLDGNGLSQDDPNNQAYHVCLHCPFVGNSPAELKRHSRVHSDEKPFICKTCGYCSKWKCDLKKHLRTYNHTSAVPLTYGGHGRKPADWKDKSEDGTSDGDSNDGEKLPSEIQFPSPDKSDGPFLYKCDKCQYVTYKKNFMDSHMKIHRTNVAQKQAGRLKCKQCEFEASDLPTFLQHKLSHSTQPPGEALTRLVSPETVNQAMAEPVISSKHRRKASYQNRIVSSRPGIEDEDLEMDFISHDTEAKKPLPTSAVAPNSQDSKSARSASGKLLAYKCVHCPYKTDNRNNYEKHGKFHNTPNKYTCEWCSWSIDRLNLLYRHAQTVHPIELALQEKATFYGKVRGRRPSETTSQEGNEDIDSKYEMPTSPEENTAEIAFRKMSWAKRQDMSNIEKRRVEARRECSGIDDELPPGLRSKRRRRLKTCSKCGYITDNVTTLQRHMAKHGSHGKFTCDYCDYSVDRQHIVEYHIKIVHQTSDSMNSQSEEPSEYDGEPLGDMDPAMADDDHSDDDAIVGVTNDGEELDPETMSNSENNKNVMNEIIKVKGRQMRVQRNGGKTTYHCLKCPYVTCNITNASNHIKQHGARKKYTCELCDYSLDQLRHVMQHMKKVHGHGIDCSFSDTGEDLPFGDQVDDTVNDTMYDEDTLDYDNLPRSTQLVGGHIPKVKTVPNRRPASGFRCRKCLFVARDFIGFKRHKTCHRSTATKFRCLKCGYKSTTSRLLNVHIKTHQSSNDV